jgi:hypothetical protein
LMGRVCARSILLLLTLTLNRAERENLGVR